MADGPPRRATWLFTQRGLGRERESAVGSAVGTCWFALSLRGSAPPGLQPVTSLLRRSLSSPGTIVLYHNVSSLFRAFTGPAVGLIKRRSCAPRAGPGDRSGASRLTYLRSCKDPTSLGSHVEWAAGDGSLNLFPKGPSVWEGIKALQRGPGLLGLARVQIRQDQGQHRTLGGDVPFA